jgi:dTDP-4-dehydrorhamnose reductase
VFDGKGDIPYKTDDPINPLGIYGLSKAEGENEVRETLPQHVIVRTSWLYGTHGANFVKTMIRLAKERKELRVVNDQKGCPTFAGDLADAVIKIVESINDGQEMKWGTYHYCNKGVTSWYHFAKKTIELASEYENLALEKIVPIPTTEYPTPAPRPAFSALDCSSFESAFGVEMRPWEESLKKMIRQLYGSAHSS